MGMGRQVPTGENRGPQGTLWEALFSGSCQVLSVWLRPVQGVSGSSGPSRNGGGGSYWDETKPRLSSCECRLARRTPASTDTCFFSMSTCKQPAQPSMMGPSPSPHPMARFPACLSLSVPVCCQLEPTPTASSQRGHGKSWGFGNILCSTFFSQQKERRSREERGFARGPWQSWDECSGLLTATAALSPTPSRLRRWGSLCRCVESPTREGLLLGGALLDGL